MTLTIVLFAVFLLGFVLFGYHINKMRSANKDDALESGKQIRRKRETHAGCPLTVWAMVMILYLSF